MAAAEAAGTTINTNRVGSMLTVFFTNRRVRDWDGAATCDTAAFGRYFRGMLAQGIYLPCSQFEAAFVAACHGDAEIDRTLACARRAFREAA